MGGGACHFGKGSVDQSSTEYRTAGIAAAMGAHKAKPIWYVQKLVPHIAMGDIRKRDCSQVVFVSYMGLK
jgi:hypothetical protein